MFIDQSFGSGFCLYPHKLADPDPKKNADPDSGQKGKKRNE